MPAPHPRPSRSPITRSLVAAALLLGASAALALLSPEYLSAEAARRFLGVLLGTVVVFYANAVPKALAPLVRMRCDPAAEQALRRVTGWSLVLGGLAYAVTWMVAPLAIANALSGTLLAASLLLVLVRIAWATRSRGARA